MWDVDGNRYIDYVMGSRFMNSLSTNFEASQLFTIASEILHKK
tara:strand:+ start:183 stop:311 length:129 start_codon:yes stop_codon:yes gene_type:complete